MEEQKTLNEVVNVACEATSSEVAGELASTAKNPKIGLFVVGALLTCGAVAGVYYGIKFFKKKKVEKEQKEANVE